MAEKYIFTSERLGFRNWFAEDLEELAALNADEAVMEHFPATLTTTETAAFISRLRQHFSERKYTYFATEILSSGEWIGFIGLAYQTYETTFTPATDIGWRLKKSAWGKGYATEGAKKCLDYAFNTLHLPKIIATCTAQNVKSENVMQKIGMHKKGFFNHPRLKDYPAYEKCLWYEITKEQF
ncbi:MAG: GNAT family N-acetyltransferase [Chitinophagales bacterium]|nr:GNAT family N-acetyltransferase [Bacteroidota bacterium]MCB9042385.1 GNAT family N-acetyltransferase [Chitinophagales bacterium]